MRICLCICLLLLAPVTFAQTVISFWHSQDQTEDLIQTFADEFNAQHPEYKVVPEYAGNYQESAIKLVAAMGTDNAPVLFDAETTIFSRLVQESALKDLSPLVAALPEETMNDIYEKLWQVGEQNGGRYGLPWNASTPVLFYNATAFEQRDTLAPHTWEDFEAAADRLTTRNTRGYIDVAAAFIFEAMVTTRGGQIVTDDGQPNFVSPEAIEALTMLQRMAQEKHSIPRGFAELDQALVDFARTKGMMAIASQAFFPQGDRFSVGFHVAATPLPVDPNVPEDALSVPLMGAQLSVLKDANNDEAQGAFLFWQYLIQTDTNKRWVEASYFIPVTHTATDALANWYNEDPSRRASLEQLDMASFRPQAGAYVVWQGYLEEAIERVTKGRADPEEALQEAQTRALNSQ